MGTVDLGQKYHSVGMALINSENKKQLLVVVNQLYKFGKIVDDFFREMEEGGGEAEDPLKPVWGVADNSDALQAAILAQGADVVNCKIHASRNVDNERVVPTEGKTRKANAKLIRRDMARVDTLALHSGVAPRGTGIAEVVLRLFTEKHEDEQGAYIEVYKQQYVDGHKGLHQHGYLNPGSPNHTNALESHNNQIKEDGK